MNNEDTRIRINHNRLNAGVANPFHIIDDNMLDSAAIPNLAYATSVAYTDRTANLIMAIMEYCGYTYAEIQKSDLENQEGFLEMSEDVNSPNKIIVKIRKTPARGVGVGE